MTTSHWEAFAEWKIGEIHCCSRTTRNNTEVDDNDTGYLFGAKYGSAKNKGTWDITYFYEKLRS